MTTTLTAEQRQAAIALLSRLPRNVQAAAIERARRERIKADILAGLHEKQQEAYALLMVTTYLAMCASRRAGKTYLCGALITLALLESGRGEYVVYIAPTAQIGKELIWDQLIEFNEKYELKWQMKEHPVCQLTTPTGAKFRICGVDDKGQLGKLRGKKYRLVICDESKEYSNFLEELVDEIFGPAFMGVGGRMLVTGTPGRHCTEHDYWYAICHGLKQGWLYKHFTLRDNPWIKDPDKALAKVREEKGWTEDNVIYLREYVGLWISNLSERVYAYLPGAPGEAGRNTIMGTPAHYDIATWTHVIGVDFGYSPDPSAWCVLASHRNERDVYVVHVEKHLEYLSDQAAELTAELVLKYKPCAVVGDNGGSGKQYVEDFNRRQADKLKTWIKPADKLGKRDHQEIAAEEMKAARIKLCMPHASDLGLEMTNLGWKNAKREEENPSTPNDLCDAFLYGFRELKAYWHKPIAAEVVKPPEQVAAEALAARQQKAAFAKKAGAFGGGRR